MTDRGAAAPSSVGELLEATAESLPIPAFGTKSRPSGRAAWLRTSARRAKRLGSSGYVVETVPLALAAAWHAEEWEQATAVAERTRRELSQLADELTAAGD